MSDLRDAEELLHHALRSIEKHTPYAEALAQRSDGTDIRIDRTGTALNVSPRLSGVALRAWAGDHWIEVAASRTDAASLEAAAHSLTAQLQRHPASHPAPGTPATGHLEAVHPSPRPMKELSVEARIACAQDWRSWALATAGVADATALIASYDDSRLFLNTAGARRYQQIGRTIGLVQVIAMENGHVEYEAVRQGGVGGQEHLDAITQEKVGNAAQGALALLQAKSPPSGTMNVLLDPSTSGTLAHESFGHGTEADQFVRQRSYLQPIFGNPVGPEILSIVDDGTYPGGWGTIYFDDEGTPAQRNLLIDHGKFVGVLHDRTSAAALGAVTTASARRSDFLSRLWVRMTNTLVVPGDWSKEELIRETGNGVLLENTTSGIEDPLGGLMQIKVHKGWRIEHGQLTDLLSGMALSGKVLDVLRSVRGVGKAAEFEIETGFCGKGHSDYIPVGTGGPHLLTRAVVGPA